MIHVEMVGVKLVLNDEGRWRFDKSQELPETGALLIYLNGEFGPEWEPEDYEPDRLMAQARAALADLGVGKVVWMSAEHETPAEPKEGVVY